MSWNALFSTCWRRKDATNEIDGEDPRAKLEHAVFPTNELFTLLGYWDDFCKRCQTHSEDARWLVETRNTQFGHRRDTILQCLSRYGAPYKAYEAVIRAYPAAVTMKSCDWGQIPLHTAASRVRFGDTLEIFELLLNRTREPTLHTVVETALPLPADIVQEHIMGFLGNALMQQDNGKRTVLHAMFENSWDSDKKTEALKLLLHAAPKLAAVQCDQGMTPLHRAVSVGAPFQHLYLLVEAYPDALITRNREFKTPLYVFLGTYNPRDGNTARFIATLKLLAETRPRAVLIRGPPGLLPYEIMYYENGYQYERKWLRLMTETQRKVPLSPAEMESGLFH